MSSEAVTYEISPVMNTTFHVGTNVMKLSSVWDFRSAQIASLWQKEDYDKRSSKSKVDLYTVLSPLHDEVRKLAKKLNIDLGPLIVAGLRTTDWYDSESFQPDRMIVEMNLILKMMERLVRRTVSQQQKLIDAAYALPVRHATGRDLSEFCASCIEDFEEGDLLVVFPCQHMSHHKCVSQILLSLPFCPTDRRSILNGERVP